MASASTQDSMMSASPVADSVAYKRHEERLPNKYSDREALYLIVSDIGMVKIGISIDPYRRIDEIRTGSPCKVELLYYFEIADAEEVEKQLHDEYAEQRKQGEWFDLSNRQLKNIHVGIKRNRTKIKSDDYEIDVDELDQRLSEYGLHYTKDSFKYKKLKYIYEHSNELLKIEPYEINENNLRVLWSVCRLGTDDIAMILDHHPDDINFALVNCGFKFEKNQKPNFNRDHHLYAYVAEKKLHNIDKQTLIASKLYDDLGASVYQISNLLDTTQKPVISTLVRSQYSLRDSTKDKFTRFVDGVHLQNKLASKFS